MNSKFHLEKTDYEPTKPATLSPVGIWGFHSLDSGHSGCHTM
jgi:hypothetical protein